MPYLVGGKDLLKEFSASLDAPYRASLKPAKTTTQKSKDLKKETKEKEKNYQDMTAEYKKIMMEQYVLFCKKHRNYGTGNINVGTNLDTDNDVKLALTGLWFRLNDKIQRLKQLIVLGEPDTVEESIDDTFQDLSIYGIIAKIVQRKKFK